ncbi:MAG: DinB superfamily protein, partial [Flavipsychrobacter sp.]|nr:DinB superfamily protein [Flavipsychrobacter sp.]
TLHSLTDDDLQKTIYIRGEGHTVLEAINRQIAHYSYHVGQIVYVSKLRIKDEWHSLSIPRNKSEEYNKKRFSK